MGHFDLIGDACCVGTASVEKWSRLCCRSPVSCRLSLFETRPLFFSASADLEVAEGLN